MIQFTIKTLDSNNHQFSVDDEITVSQLKEKVLEQMGIEVNLQRLIFCGRVLQDEKKLSEYDVEGKVVHLVQRAPPSPESRHSAPSSANTSNSTPNENTGAAQQQIRRLMAMTAAPNLFSDEQQALNISPTSGRMEFIRRMISDIKSSLASLQAHLHNEGNADPPGESQNQEPMNTDTNAPPTQEEPESQMDDGEDSSDRGMRGLHNVRRRSYRAFRALRARHTRPRDLAQLLEELESLQDEFGPHRALYIDMLRASQDSDAPPMTDEERQRDQRTVDMISDVMHSFSHAYHALSDIYFNVSQRNPRLTSENVMRHPIPMQAHINVVQANRRPILAQGPAPATATSANENGNEGAAAAQTAPPSTGANEAAQATQPASQAGRNTTQPTFNINIQPDPITYQVEIETRVPIAFALENAMLNGLVNNGANAAGPPAPAEPPAPAQSAPGATGQAQAQAPANRRQLLFDFENLFRGLGQPGTLGGVEVVMSMEEIPQPVITGQGTTMAQAISQMIGNPANVAGVENVTTTEPTPADAADAGHTPANTGDAPSVNNETGSPAASAPADSDSAPAVSAPAAVPATSGPATSGTATAASLAAAIGTTGRLLNTGQQSGVYIASMPWGGGANADLLQNIVTSVIRQGFGPLENMFPLQNLTAHAEVAETPQAAATATPAATATTATAPSTTQGRQPSLHLRRATTTHRAQAVSLANLIYDRFLHCDSPHARRRLQRRREEHLRQIAAQERLRAERAAAQNIETLREREQVNLSESNVQTMVQMLNSTPSNESWLNAIIVAIARHLFMSELMQPVSGEPPLLPNEFQSLRLLLRYYAQDLVARSGAEEGHAAYQSVADYLMETQADFVNRIPTMTPTRRDMNLFECLRLLMRSRLPGVIATVNSNSNAESFAACFYALFARFFTELCAAVAYYCREGSDGLRIVFSSYLDEISASFSDPVRRMVRTLGLDIFNGILSFLPQTTENIRNFLQRAEVECAPSPDDPLSMDVESSSEEMQTSPPGTPPTPAASASGAATPPAAPANDGPSTSTATPTAPTTALANGYPQTNGYGSPGRASPGRYDKSEPSPPRDSETNVRFVPPMLILQHWGEEWVPVFTRDSASRPPPAEPYSDAYMSGMPSRKRRRVRDTRAPPSLDTFMNESVREASARAPAAGGDRGAIRLAFRERLRAMARARAADSDDYDPARYTAAARFLNSPKPEHSDSSSES